MEILVHGKKLASHCYCYLFETQDGLYCVLDEEKSEKSVVHVYATKEAVNDDYPKLFKLAFGKDEFEEKEKLRLDAIQYFKVISCCYANIAEKRDLNLKAKLDELKLYLFDSWDTTSLEECRLDIWQLMIDVREAFEAYLSDLEDEICQQSVKEGE